MLAIQCKLCGGDIEITPGEAIGTCAYCGSANTYPKTEDESKILLFNDANNLRRAGEFDKALAIYEKMLAEDRNDAELHWCCALSRFGVIYEEDMASFQWIPNCHRTTLENFLEDADYLAAIQNFQGIEQRRCQQDAEKIADTEHIIRQGAQDIPPFDVFISCKAVDEEGNRNEEGRLTQGLYEQLTAKGLRVFYAPVTLSGNDHIKNESVTYAALTTAKAMVVVATKKENFEYAWVRNDWVRFLKLGKMNKAPIIACCRDTADVPSALAGMPSCDVDETSFTQDVFTELNKVLSVDLFAAPAPEPVPEPVKTPVVEAEPEKKEKKEKKEKERKEKKKKEKIPEPIPTPVKETVPQPQPQPKPEPVPIPEPEPEPEIPIDDLLDEGYRHLATGMWEMADECFKQALSREARCGRAYFGQYLKENRYISDEHMASKLQQDMDLITGETIPFKGDPSSEIEVLAEKYVIPGYLTRDMIAEKVAFSGEYVTCAKKQQEYYEKVKNSFETNQMLARACSDDTDGFGPKLNDFLRTTLSGLLQTVKNSEQKDEENLVKLQNNYEKHLSEAREEIAGLYTKSLEQQEQDYMDACGQITEAKTIEDYEKLSIVFGNLAGYKNSDQFKKHCDNKVANAEVKEKKESKKKVLVICGCVVGVLAVAVAIFLPKYLKYSKAVGLLESGKYDQAVAAFSELGSYLSSEDKKVESVQKYVGELQSKGNYDQAEQVIQQNFTGWDQQQMLQQCYAAQAQGMDTNTATNVAALEKLLDKLVEDKDKEVVQDKLDEYYYTKGNEAAEQGNFKTATEFFGKVVKQNKSDAKSMLDMLEDTMSDPLYSYIEGVTWKLDSCTLDGKKHNEDVTKFSGVHVRIENKKAIFYVTFDQKDIDLKDYSSISNISVKSGNFNYVLGFGSKSLKITGKMGGKKVVSNLTC